jgi:hypothetical protein
MVDAFIIRRMDLIRNVENIFVSLQTFANIGMATVVYLLGVGVASGFFHDDM